MKRIFSAAICLLAGCGTAANVEHDCTANGYGRVSCEFHNKGGSKGSACVKLVLTQKSGGKSLESRAICSGVVNAHDVLQRETNGGFTESPSDFCGSYGSGSWTDMCDMNVESASED